MISGNNQSCMLCGAEEYETICSYTEPDKYERAVGIALEGYKRKWVQCAGCGLYYSKYSRQPDALERIYIADYRAGTSCWRNSTTEEIFNNVVALPPHQSETKQRVNWIKSQIDNFWRGEIIKKGTPPYRVLDIGGATGVFAFEFRDAEWLPYVIDPSRDGSFIQSKYGVPYKQQYYKPGEFEERFDLITLIFVLEHYRDPVSLLQQVRMDMKNDSLLYIEVPDALCFKHKPSDDDIFNSCHLWMFSPVTLSRLLDICGLEIFNLQRTKTIRGHYSLMSLSGIK